MQLSAKKEINKQIQTLAKESISRKAAETAEELNRRTRFYIILSAFGLFLILAPLPKIIFFPLCVVLIGAILFLLAGAIRQIAKLLFFIDNFEERLRKFVEQELERVKGTSFKAKAGIWLSGYNREDIENLCVSHIFREFTRQFKKKKRFVAVRIGSFLIIGFLFSKILIKLLF